MYMVCYVAAQRVYYEARTEGSVEDVTLSGVELDYMMKEFISIQMAHS